MGRDDRRRPRPPRHGAPHQPDPGARSCSSPCCRSTRSATSCSAVIDESRDVDGVTLARRRGADDLVPHRARHAACRDRREPFARPRPDARHRWRVGLRQERADRDRSWASSRAARSARSDRRGLVRRSRPDRAVAPRSCAALAATISIVPQNPLSSLNPVMRVGKQIAEIARATGGRRRQAGGGLERPSTCSSGRHPRARRARSAQYPHELSGGMRQRVAIAMAMAVRARPADRRRAHDGARRHRAGADPRPARAACSASATWR